MPMVYGTWTTAHGTMMLQDTDYQVSNDHIWVEPKDDTFLKDWIKPRKAKKRQRE